MYKIFFIFSLYAFSLYSMENRRVCHKSQSYLDCLNGDTALLVAHYLKGNDLALPLLLEKTSFNEQLASDMYRKILSEHTDFIQVKRFIGDIENESVKNKLKTTLQLHEDIIVDAKYEFKKNNITKIRQILEKEIGIIPSLRNIKLSTKNESGSLKFQENRPFYLQLVKELNSSLTQYRLLHQTLNGVLICAGACFIISLFCLPFTYPTRFTRQYEYVYNFPDRPTIRFTKQQEEYIEPELQFNQFKTICISPVFFCFSWYNALLYRKIFFSRENFTRINEFSYYL